MKHTVSLRKRIHRLADRSRQPVHDIRVILKKLKAGLKLCGTETRGVKTRLRTLRRHARGLSGIRDVQSRNEIVAWLRARGVRVPRVYITSPRVPQRDINKRVRLAVAAALQTADFLQVAFAQRPVRDIKRRQRHFARRVAKARRHYLKTSSLENLHRLRKRVKDYHYQLQTWLADSAAHRQQQKRLKHAGHWLGQARDLQLLGEQLRCTHRGVIDTPLIAAVDDLARRQAARALRELNTATD